MGVGNTGVIRLGIKRVRYDRDCESARERCFQTLNLFRKLSDYYFKLLYLENKKIL